MTLYDSVDLKRDPITQYQAQQATFWPAVFAILSQFVGPKWTNDPLAATTNKGAVPLFASGAQEP